MTASDLLKKHCGTQRAAASLFGYSAQQVNNWMSGRTPWPATVLLVLRIMEATGITIDELNSLTIEIDVR